MRPSRLAVLMLGVLVVAGCTVGVGTPPQSIGVIKLGVDLPLSGDDAPDGLPAKNAIDLAIKQAGRVCGASRHPDACFDLQAVAYDDVSQGIHDPAKGAKNVQLLVEDARVLAMVGPLYDSLAKSELPVAASIVYVARRPTLFAVPVATTLRSSIAWPLTVMCVPPDTCTV